MNYNRSVPPDTLLPHVCYRNVEDALAWLSKAFGFVEHYRYGEPGGRVNGAQVHLGNAWVMLRTVDSRGQTPAQLGCGTQSLTVFVDEVEAHYKRAKSAGARIVEEPHETAYGEFQYAAHDLDGHHWLFSQHATDHAPEEWGAVVAKHATRVGCLRRPRLCYIEIPARDAHSSAVFYEKVFGWSIRHRESDRPSFDDATGDISGAFVTGRLLRASPVCSRTSGSIILMQLCGCALRTEPRSWNHAIPTTPAARAISPRSATLPAISSVCMRSVRANTLSIAPHQAIATLAKKSLTHPEQPYARSLVAPTSSAWSCVSRQFFRALPFSRSSR